MVDSISGMNDRLNIQELLGVSSTTNKNMMPTDMGGASSDQLQLSSIGQIVGAARESGASEEELEAFREKIMEAVQNGTFDAKTLAEQAPDSMKQAAEKQGIDLSSALDSMAQDIETRGAYPPPPPPPSDMNSDEESEKSNSMKQLVDAALASGASEDELEAFRKKIMDAIQSGTFDASALAEEAPDSLKQSAEEQGIDLSEALQLMSEQG